LLLSVQYPLLSFQLLRGILKVAFPMRQFLLLGGAIGLEAVQLLLQLANRLLIIRLLLLQLRKLGLQGVIFRLQVEIVGFRLLQIGLEAPQLHQ